MIPALGYYYANKINTRIWLKKARESERRIEIDFSFAMDPYKATFKMGDYGLMIEN
jgi:hypothetical protein